MLNKWVELDEKLTNFTKLPINLFQKVNDTKKGRKVGKNYLNYNKNASNTSREIIIIIETTIKL